MIHPDCDSVPECCFLWLLIEYHMKIVIERLGWGGVLWLWGVTLFLWRSGFAQKHAQSTGNRMNCLWEKKSRQKIRSEDEVRAVLQKKVPSP